MLNMFKNNCITDSLKRNAIYLILNAGLGNGFGFIFWIIVAKYYTPSEVGLASALISVSMIIATIANLGFGIGIIRYLPEMKKNSSKLINSFMLVSGLLAVIISYLFLSYAETFSKNLVYINNSFLYKISFIVITVCLVLVPMQDHIFIAKKRSEYAIIKNLVLGTRVFFPIMLVSFGSIGIFGSYGIAYIISVLASILWFIPRVVPGYSFDLSVERSLINKTLRYSVGNYIANLCQTIPTFLIPIIITVYLNPESSAYFYIAWTIANILYVIPRSIATSFFAEGVSESSQYENGTKKSFELILLFVIPSILFTLIFSHQILSIFGSTYSENAEDLLKILALSTLPISFNEIYFTIWRIENKIRDIIVINALIALVTLGIGYISIERLGLYSFAISWTLAQTTILLYNSRNILIKASLQLKNQIAEYI